MKLSDATLERMQGNGPEPAVPIVPDIRWSKRVGTQRYLRLAARAVRMTPGEVAVRLADSSIARRLLRPIERLGETRQAAARTSFVESFGPNVRLGLATVLSRRFLFGPADEADLRAVVLKHRKAHAERVVSLAEAIRLGRVDVLGHLVPLVPGSIDWQADPRHGLRHWTGDAFSETCLNAASARDVKFVWEINRHQYLTLLGRAFWLTGDASHAAFAADLTADWIDNNPSGRGVNWSSSLEVGVRSISWVWTMGYLIACPDLSDEFVAAWLASLADHYDYLRRHLSTYTDPTNHLIGEASALWLLATIFEQLPDSARQQRRAMKVIARAVEDQFAPDGVNREQATGYLRFALDFLFQILALAQRLEVHVSPVVVDRTSQATGFVVALLGADGLAPMIGDSDDGRGIPFPELTGWDFRDVACTGAMLFGRGDWKARAGELAETAVWLGGTTGVKRYTQLTPVPEEPRSAVFPRGGYCIFHGRQDDVRISSIFDVGPLGLWPNAAHGHADALSVLIALNGRFVLTDPGTGAYHEHAPVREQLRSTAAHNTVTVDGLSQADPFDVFKWVNPFRCKLLGAFTGSNVDYAAAAHDAYGRLRRRVWHQRHVLYIKPQCWVIVDFLSGSGEHVIGRHFSLAPDTTIEREGIGAVKVSTGTGYSLRFLFPDIHEAQHVAFSQDAGIHSARYARWVSAPRLTVQTRTSLPTSFCTFIQLEQQVSGSCRGQNRATVQRVEQGTTAWRLTNQKGIDTLVALNVSGRSIDPFGTGSSAAQFRAWTSDSGGILHRLFEARLHESANRRSESSCLEF